MVGGGAADMVPSAPVKVFSAGAAGCVADLVTFPLDTAKVRLQVRTSYCTGSGENTLLNARILEISPQRSPYDICDEPPMTSHNFHFFY